VCALASFKPLEAHICPLGAHLCPLGLNYAPWGSFMLHGDQVRAPTQARAPPLGVRPPLLGMHAPMAAVRAPIELCGLQSMQYNVSLHPAIQRGSHCGQNNSNFTLSEVNMALTLI
jgi:hypothetical protein